MQKFWCPWRRACFFLNLFLCMGLFIRCLIFTGHRTNHHYSLSIINNQWPCSKYSPGPALRGRGPLLKGPHTSYWYWDKQFPGVIHTHVMTWISPKIIQYTMGAVRYFTSWVNISKYLGQILPQCRQPSPATPNCCPRVGQEASLMDLMSEEVQKDFFDSEL